MSVISGFLLVDGTTIIILLYNWLQVSSNHILYIIFKVSDSASAVPNCRVGTQTYIEFTNQRIQPKHINTTHPTNYKYIDRTPNIHPSQPDERKRNIRIYLSSHNPFNL